MKKIVDMEKLNAFCKKSMYVEGASIYDYHLRDAVEAIKRWLEEQPDAEEKHGKWESVSPGVWECSNCKEIYALGFDCHPYNDCCMLYCQTCGAKMDLGEEKEEA